MTQIDGGPAFPCIDAMNVENEGMSLRDYFAAAALMKMLIKADENVGDKECADRSTRFAYMVADAMLAHRLK